MAKLINEIGNNYRYLTVIDRVENKNNRAMWKCKCKCGNECIVSGKLLRNGHTKSCGCLKNEKTIQRNIERGGNDLTGQRFGNLVVIEFNNWYTKPSGKRTRVWKCQCDCGNICFIQHQYLRCGDTGSCGCTHSKGNSTITRWLNSHNIYYKNEYTFNDFITKTGTNYRFDFGILNDDNTIKFLIEYQGSIHFFAEGNGWNTEEALVKRKQYDQDKLEYCQNQNIKIYYITYLEDIEARLEEIFSEQS